MNLRYLPALAVLSVLFSCDNDDEKASSLRPSIDYNSLKNDVAYADQFHNENHESTVDLTEGNTLHKMFQGLNYHGTSSIAANTTLEAQQFIDLFSNSGNPFIDVSTATISINGDELNASGQRIEDHVASSLPGSEKALVNEYLYDLFDQIELASGSINQEASKGVAGKIGTYLVDDKGFELIQVIQKSLIGAYQLDYIGNVLLDEGLNADNTKLVAGQNYTALEHNWDIAYGFLTLNPIYLEGATDAVRGTTEFGAGAYIWEYNKGSYAQIYGAFLKGRAAIVNNDRAELERQADFIRTEFEKAIANAALGYLDKWKAGDTEAKRVHAFGEGLGFIYSLRFAKKHDADAEFSDHVIDHLVGSEFGYWDLTVSKINHAADEIREQFNF